MRTVEVSRTLVKSPPELWSELSGERLSEAVGGASLRVTEEERRIEWEAEGARGAAVLEPAGWGTKLTLTAEVEEEVGALEPDVARMGLWARLRRTARLEPPAAPEPETSVRPERARGDARAAARRPRLRSPAALPERLSRPLACGGRDGRPDPHHAPRLPRSERLGRLPPLGARAPAARARRPPERARDRGGHAAGRPRVRRPRAHAEHGRARARGPPLHARHPEAMPTVPVRNSLLSGRRNLPFRGWHDWRGLLDAPGLGSRSTGVGASLPAVLRRAGYWTAYVTDNPFLGFSAAVPAAAAPLRPLRAHRRPDRRPRAAACPSTSCATGSIPRSSATPKVRTRMRKLPRQRSRYSHDESRSFAARVFTRRRRGARTGRHAAALRDRGGHLRAARAVDAAAQVHQPLRRPRLPRPRARPAALRTIDDYFRGGDPARMLARMRALYAAEVTMTDRWLGVFLDRLHDLAPRPRDDRSCSRATTASCSASTAGPGRSPTELHPALIRVPLVVVDPRAGAPGDASDYLAQTPRRGATVLSLAGVRAPRAHERDRPVAAVRGRQPPGAPARLRRLRQRALRPHRALEADRATTAARNRRLYDSKRDPGETHNVARRTGPRRGDVRRGGAAGRRAAAVLRGLARRPSAGGSRLSGRMRQKSPETYEEKLAQLEELREQAIHTNPQAEEKQHSKGKLTARERIEKLLDPGLLPGARHLRPPPHRRLRHARQPALGRRGGDRARPDRRPPGGACSPRTSRSSAARSAR